jgi:hypothetical protein
MGIHDDATWMLSSGVGLAEDHLRLRASPLVGKADQATDSTAPNGVHFHSARLFSRR